MLVSGGVGARAGVDLRRMAADVDADGGGCGGDRLVGEGARREATREGRATGAVVEDVEGLEGLADLEEFEGTERTDVARGGPAAARDVLDCR